MLILFGSVCPPSPMKTTQGLRYSNTYWVDLQERDTKFGGLPLSNKQKQACFLPREKNKKSFKVICSNTTLKNGLTRVVRALRSWHTPQENTGMLKPHGILPFPISTVYSRY